MKDKRNKISSFKMKIFRILKNLMLTIWNLKIKIEKKKRLFRMIRLSMT